MGLAAKDGNLPRIPRRGGPVGNAGAVGGKARAEFDARIVSQCDRFPIRQQLDINLTRSEKCASSPNECEHTSIGRMRRVNG